MALDGDPDGVFACGFPQTSGGGQPVQIAYLRGQGYDGEQKWLSYNCGGAQVDGTGETNNIADTRGLRPDVGDDGRLYAASQAAGGSYILRYSPANHRQPVPLVGGDAFHKSSTPARSTRRCSPGSTPTPGRFYSASSSPPGCRTAGARH